MLTAPVEIGSARCHVCGAADLELAPAYPRFRRVTSDCKPWPAGGSLARCRACGSVQTRATASWQQEADAIYAGYTIYEQGGGAEQQVFGDGRGIGQPRSDRLVARLREAVGMPDRGRLLDIGCGNGSFLAAWNRVIPGWQLHGTEFDTKHLPELERIPGFAGLWTSGPHQIEGTFDVISLVHVLEHIPDPLALLERCRERLHPNGLLFIEVPDCQQNPFMLLVADHCSHFSPDLLAAVVSAAGFEVHEATNQWVPKEISVVARPGHAAADRNNLRCPTEDSEAVFAGWHRLEAILAKATPLARRRPFGLFGTAIAATWLDAELDGTTQFFVDEDPTRVGKSHLNRPILAPAEVPIGATVFVALPPPLAGQVTERLLRLDRGLQVEQP